MISGVTSFNMAFKGTLVKIEKTTVGTDKDTDGPALTDIAEKLSDPDSNVQRAYRPFGEANQGTIELNDGSTEYNVKYTQGFRDCIITVSKGDTPSFDSSENALKTSHIMRRSKIDSSLSEGFGRAEEAIYGLVHKGSL